MDLCHLKCTFCCYNPHLILYFVAYNFFSTNTRIVLNDKEKRYKPKNQRV